MNPITSFKGRWSFLSNFFPVEVPYEGVVYPSVEHAYQAAKFPVEMRQSFRAGTPAYAKKKGRQPGMRPDWDELKLAIMEDLVRQKFQNPKLRILLESTGQVHLEEGNWWGDTFWGVCRGLGRNELGKILMKVRGE